MAEGREVTGWQDRIGWAVREQYLEEVTPGLRSRWEADRVPNNPSQYTAHVSLPRESFQTRASVLVVSAVVW